MANRERMLTTIVATDVAGYSRLMHADEEGTLDRLKRARAITDPMAREHGGRIVGSWGDGVVAEFPSVVEAVSFALQAQAAMGDFNADTPDEAKLLYRIGVNLGDIIVDGDDIYGDGVNVAARLEALAKPGGICISRSARDQIRDKMDVAFEDLGAVEIKNIVRPVRVFRVSAATEVIADLEPGKSASPVARPTAATALPLPDKPSIAVLPFDNMSGDTEQDYFSDGITEDIITALSKLHWLFVIARNSTFTYKGSAVDVTRVARELGVRYVLEGSVRKAANRVRITAQLVDGPTGNHVWADRYDRELDDIFTLQDEITESIVGHLDTEIRTSEIERARRKPPANLDAWELYHRGLWCTERVSREDNKKALDFFQMAIKRDPNFALANAGVAYCCYHDVAHGLEPDSKV